MMQFVPGDRVRCVDAGSSSILDEGQNYEIVNPIGYYTFEIRGGRIPKTQRVAKDRFKPIVRVPWVSRMIDRVNAA